MLAFSEVNSKTKSLVKKYHKMFNLYDWKLIIKKDTNVRCVLTIRYKIAELFFDEQSETLEQDVFHEIMHVVLAEFDRFKSLVDNTFAIELIQDWIEHATCKICDGVFKYLKNKN